MKPEDRYHRFVRWSEEDQCYIGYCPDFYEGGVCHGESEADTYAQLCSIILDETEHRSANVETLTTMNVAQGTDAVRAVRIAAIRIS